MKPIAWWVRLRRAAACVLLLALATSSAPVGAAPEQPWRVTEFAISGGDGSSSDHVLSGDRVFWSNDNRLGASRLLGRDLATGSDLSFDAERPSGVVDLDGDYLLVVEPGASDGDGLAAYHLASGARIQIAASALGVGSRRHSARISGQTVVWIDGADGRSASDVFIHDLRTRGTRRLPIEPAPRLAPSIADNLVVWLDRRNVLGLASGSEPAIGSSGGDLADIYGYDLAAGREFRVTATPERIGPPAISGNTVVWAVDRPDGSSVLGYDLLRATPFVVARMPIGAPPPSGIDISDDLVVWSAKLAGDFDVYGFDLRRWQQFIVSRAIGDQLSPRVSGRAVVWMDLHASGLTDGQHRAEVFGARLTPGPAVPPPTFGAPLAADARVEIVWPHGDAPVTEATRANVSAWLFLPNTLDLPPCQWNPRVRLLRAVNDGPALALPPGRKWAGHLGGPDGGVVPTWEFDDVDVSAAREPETRIYFLVALDGVPYRTSVWAHGVDARTFFPRPDEPKGVAAGPTGPEGVDARIQVVWPHGDAPVERASLVNVSALVFRSGSSLSVPPEFAPRVRLLRSLNNGYLEPVATGDKRLVAGNGFTYPAWEFDDVDVSAASDPGNRYYFTLEVEGVPSTTNVWAHGADARTYAPTPDRPTAACR